MRLDVVILVMLVTWIGLGFGGAELIQTNKELNACELQAEQVQQALVVIQDENAQLQEKLGISQNMLAETQLKLTGIQDEYGKSITALNTCTASNNFMQDKVRVLEDANTSCSARLTAVESGASEKMVLPAPWAITLTAVPAAIVFVLRKIASARRRIPTQSNDYVRLTEMERQLIVNLRRNQARNRIR